ncbi:MAG: permease-like cell division protein FtsX [Acutalibacteraceae bacterium]|jgi:cell division transport system permease protein
MRLSSMRYLLREGFRNIWQNRFMSFASILVLISCLLLTGGAYLVYENINNAFKQVYEQNVVVVFAEEKTTADQLTAMQKQLEGIQNVRSVKYVSKDETLQNYKNDIPKATFEEMQGDANPMLDLFVVTFDDLEQFEPTLQRIRQVEHIDDISSNQSIAQTLTKVRGIVLSVAGWIIGVLLLVALFIISNTIKLTVYSRRLEIYIMKSVGATNRFIRFPFVIEGMILGLASGGLAYGIIYYLYTRLAGMFSFAGVFGLIAFTDVWWQMLVGFLVAGVLTGMLGSAISMGRYLKRDGGMADE